MEVLARRLPQALGLLLGLLAGCEDAPCTPDQCDIRQAGCQRAVMDATSCLSGVDAVDVDVEVISAEDYSRMQAEAVEDLAMEADVLATQRALALLDLGPAGDTPIDVAIDRADNTAASYSPEDNRVYIIDRGVPLDSKSAVALLVHEFTHALQFGIEDRLPTETPPTTDAYLALAATIEGEASWNGDRALKLLVDGSTADVDWRILYDSWVDATWRHYQDEHRKVARARSYFAYAFGARFLLDQDLTSTKLPVAASTLEVMHGFRPMHAALAAVPVVDGEKLLSDSLGSFVVEGWLLSRMRRFDVPWALYPPFVESDTLTILRAADGKLAAVWHIEFDDTVEGLAAAFADLEVDDSRLGAIGHVATTTLDSRTMLVFAAEDEQAVRDWALNPPDFDTLDFSATGLNTDMAARFLSCPHSRKE